jgi:excisionase family DNA binding protein
MTLHALPFGGVLESYMESSSVAVLGQSQKQNRKSASSTVVAQIAPTGLLTPEQAASYLGMAPATLMVWRSTNRRVLTYVKIGSSVRYRREDLDKFIAANLCNA